MKVFIIAAVSADGFIARSADDFSMDWTSPEDVKLFVKLTKEAGVMVMGSRTFDTLVKAGRRLPGRKIVVYTSRPDEFRHDRPDPTEATDEPPKALLKRLQAEGYESVAICGGSRVYDLFMQSGLVTDLYLTYEPVLFGAGVPLFASPMSHKLRLASQQKLGENTLAIHYEVQKP